MIAARPLTIADILDRSVNIVVQRFGVIAAIAAIDAVPNTLIIAFTRGVDTTSGALSIALVTMLLMGALTYSPFVRLGGDENAPNDVGALLRRAVRDYPRSLASFVMVYVALIVVCVIAVEGIVAFVLGVRFALGSEASLVTAVIAGLLSSVVFVPLFLVSGVAYANVILEGVGPWRGLVTAVARCRRTGFARTWLLSAAITVVSLAPVLVLEAVVRPLATSTGMWWILIPAPFLTTASGVALGTVATAVAAVDLRNRCEGADFDAALDAPAARA